MFFGFIKNFKLFKHISLNSDKQKLRPYDLYRRCENTFLNVFGLKLWVTLARLIIRQDIHAA